MNLHIFFLFLYKIRIKKMCGIVAYIGSKQASPIVIKGLKRLEYRGYDSAGIAVLENNELNIYKKKGKVAELESFINDTDLKKHHRYWSH